MTTTKTMTTRGTIDNGAPLGARDSWAVVELAGYEGENVRIVGLASRRAAWAWIGKHYPDETGREELHVDVRLDRADGSSTYEFS